VLLFAFYVLLFAFYVLLFAFICSYTNYANKISDKAGDYSGMRQHSLKFTRAAETLFPTTPIRNIIFKLVK
jgi:hypothetical protein